MDLTSDTIDHLRRPAIHTYSVNTYKTITLLENASTLHVSVLPDFKKNVFTPLKLILSVSVMYLIEAYNIIIRRSNLCHVWWLRYLVVAKEDTVCPIWIRPGNDHDWIYQTTYCHPVRSWLERGSNAR